MRLFDFIITYLSQAVFTNFSLLNTKMIAQGLHKYRKHTAGRSVFLSTF